MKRVQGGDGYTDRLEAGGSDHGPPGLRPQYAGSYFAAFVIGPDGHNIEVVCHAPSGARGKFAVMA